MIELDRRRGAGSRAFAKEIADEQHLNVAIEPRVTDAEIRPSAARDDPTPLFEIIEARTQEIQAVIEEAGILSDRIRRRGAPPWDYEDFIDDDPEFLKRYYEPRGRTTPASRCDLAEPVSCSRCASPTRTG